MDPSTLELIELIVDHTPKAPMLTLLTFRPDFRPPWPSRAHQSSLTLNRLTRQQTEVMVTRLVVTGPPRPSGSSRSSREPTASALRRRTDEDGPRVGVAQGRGRALRARTAAPAPLDPDDAPPFPHRPARPPGRRQGGAQLGATLGWAFSHQLIRAVARLDEGGSRAPRSAGGRRAAPPAGASAAHELPVQARAWSIGRLRVAAQERASGAPSANRRGSGRSVRGRRDDPARTGSPPLPEADSSLRRSSSGSDRAAAPSSDRLTWKRSGISGKAWSSSRRFPIPASGPSKSWRSRAPGECHRLRLAGTPPWTWRRPIPARVSSASSGDTRRLLPVLMGLLRLYLVRADLRRARQIGEQLLAGGEAAEDPAHRLNAHYTLVYVPVLPGRVRSHPRARGAGSGGVRSGRAQSTRDRRGAGPGSLLPVVRVSGFVDAGVSGPGLAKERGSVGARARALAHLQPGLRARIVPMFRQCRREVRVVEEHVEAMLPLCQEQEFAFHLGWATILRAWSSIEQGPTDQDLDQMRARPDHLRVDRRRDPSAVLAGPARPRPVGGWDESRKASRSSAPRWTRSDSTASASTRRSSTGSPGLCSWRPGRTAPRACFVQAIDVAREQGARSLELLGHRAPEPALPTAGRRRLRLGGELAELYAWFSEGFETADLTVARALLAELA